MSKLETAVKLFKLSLKRPSSYLSSTKYALKYGLLGLRDKYHQKILESEFKVPEPNTVPGSISGSITFSVIMPVYNVDLDLLKEAVDSVTSQTYENWELCIVDDASTNTAIHHYLKTIQSNKIKLRFLDANEGISGASNHAAQMATGQYLVPFDNDDLLSPVALEFLASKANETYADIIYTDNDVIDRDGNRLAYFFKPDWSPDLLRAQNYFGHLVAFKKELFDEIGGYDSGYDGAQDYDLALRMIETTTAIEHVPENLYSWRSIPTSTSGNPNSKPYAQTAGLRALQTHLDRVYGNDVCKALETDNLFVYDVEYPLPDDALATIVIPTKDRLDDVETAVRSIYNHTDSKLFDILVLDNNSEELDSKERLATLEQKYSNLRVIEAPGEFNWSRLNNIGIKEGSGTVFIFLNNDTEVLTDNWIEPLMANALRKDVGAVGPLLLYPDKTIQHAGVVIGMNGWADHVYKAEPFIHNGNPYISPSVTRNVAAVTGACMAISKDKIDTYGLFDEDFIICGSDIEMCLRLHRHHLRNIYLPTIKLTHYESKSRDASKIPLVDYKHSAEAYREMLETGDPYYNSNLDINNCIPTVISALEKQRQEIGNLLQAAIPVISPVNLKPVNKTRNRLNLLIPAINPKDIYGGIATALQFFYKIVDDLDIESRIIVLDGPVDPKMASSVYPKYSLVKAGQSSDKQHQIVDVTRRPNASIDIFNNEWFIATSWWSAYILQEELARLNAEDFKFNPLLYLIQDYEPGFYAWSDHYLLAEATYRSQVPTIAIYNSSQLANHMSNLGYQFEAEHYFEPYLNPALQVRLDRLNGHTLKRKKILIYGRPGVPRNGFNLIVEGLKRFVTNNPKSDNWDFVSAGESHHPVPLGNGRYLTSVGKLTLDEYATLLSESYAGVSIMVSPHPSYPPLEMAAFGVKVITNQYSNKDLSDFSENITSLRIATPNEIEKALSAICDEYQPEATCGYAALKAKNYLSSKSPFGCIDLIEERIKSSF